LFISTDLFENSIHSGKSETITTNLDEPGLDRFLIFSSIIFPLVPIGILCCAIESSK
jgi:hypothetical protein